MTAISGPKKRTLSAAKLQFTTAVKQGIADLMEIAGYSRERATNLLLRELGRDGEMPTEDEIFHLMELQGLGLEEAAKALVVSKAVRRTMTRSGFSAIDAIDDLTSKLAITNLLVKSSPEKPLLPPLTPVNRRSASGPNAPIAALCSQRKPSARKHNKKSNNNKSTPALKNPRKRSISEEQPKLARARADSVTEEVNAKMAERPLTAPKVDAGIKRKDTAPGSTVQPATKRPREM